MKKVLIFLILFLFVSTHAYSFWIWSPKTQKWKNPKYSPLVTPYLQYTEAMRFFKIKQYKEALNSFKKLLVNYPDSKEAADAQYFTGRCFEELEDPFRAFEEYKKVIVSYPNSKRINEVVDRQYKIGEYFLNREPKKWLGVSWYDLVEHPSIEIFKAIVDQTPYSDYAALAQYKLGIVFVNLGRYEEARDAFQGVLDNYPGSEWSAPAQYQLAIATSKASSGADYDSRYLEEATQQLDEFIKEHPEAEISTQAKTQLQELRDKEAKKNYDIAEFYQKQKKNTAAKMYYELVIDRYPESTFAQAAQTKLEGLEVTNE